MEYTISWITTACICFASFVIFIFRNNKLELSITRLMSKIFGKLVNIKIPTFFRPIIFKIYTSIYGLNLLEISDKNLSHYESLNKFFIREIDVKYYII